MGSVAVTAPAPDRASDPAPAPATWGDPLPRAFFGRPAPEVAPQLLGCVLVHETSRGLVAVQLVEVEAYTGLTDPASHAFRGKTARNAVMFGEPGHAYVYFTYGMHFCLNLVCQPDGEAAAVLLRAGQVVAGQELAAARRRTVRADALRLASGPARLCQALGIDRAQNGADVCGPPGPLRVLGRGSGAATRPVAVAQGPRVGVRDGAEVAWRFWIDGHPAVSAYRPHVPRRRPGARGGAGRRARSRQY
jgi:DNA-3-methyladenine glycosylase